MTRGTVASPSETRHWSNSESGSGSSADSEDEDPETPPARRHTLNAPSISTTYFSPAAAVPAPHLPSSSATSADDIAAMLQRLGLDRDMPPPALVAPTSASTIHNEIQPTRAHLDPTGCLFETDSVTIKAFYSFYGEPYSSAPFDATTGIISGSYEAKAKPNSGNIGFRVVISKNGRLWWVTGAGRGSDQLQRLGAPTISSANSTSTSSTSKTPS